MRTADLDASCGLLPAGVRGLSFRGVDSDLFCWVWTVTQAEERLVALPEAPEEARRELATTLESEHGFLGGNAELATQLLFERAFAGTPVAAKPAQASRVNLREYPESRRSGARA